MKRTQLAGLRACEAAMKHLKGVPIPWDEIEQAAIDVSTASPNVATDELVELIARAALERWSSGMGCC